MAIWHHKGELLFADSKSATYRFYPDHVMAPTVAGVFRLDLTTFEVAVVEPAHAEKNGLGATDEHCMAALVHKIRRAFSETGKAPAVAYFIG